MYSKLFLFFALSFLTVSEGWGQSFTSDRLKELFRNQQLLGTYRSNHSLMVNANQLPLADLDSALGIKAQQPVIGFLPTQLVQQYNSQLPYDWNNGAMIPARGYQLQASVGVHAQLGRHLEIQLAPEAVLAENRVFEQFSSQLGDKSWAARYRFWNTIDMPDRFGNDHYQKLFPGQSFIRYNTRSLSFGISTQNLWWGPAYRNALIMSSNAPGFLHATINTIRPLHTGIGDFEGQIIAGKLDGSDVLPPRTYSVYNGQFLYQPKNDEWRYLAGMVLTWRPKWTPNLFLGFAKASYLYNSDISNPLDVLPFEGFLGHRRTQAERTGKKASLGSLFMRYIMPNEQAEMYLEYGRKDISMMPWNVLQNAPYRRAFTGGFRKLFDWKNQSHILLAVELTQLQAPDATLIRNPDSWYTHTYVRQGYTQLGRPLGAGIGPGSNSQTLEIAWVKGLKKIGIQFERLRHNGDFYYYAFESIGDFRRNWVDISTTFKADWNYQRFFFSGQLGIIRSLNYQWLVIQLDPRNYFAPGNEYLNIAAKIGVGYRF
ncbi:Capsule assembly protein Wzi [Hydrobacter penzbergensis]|uniref:Capsule assembly protein Wzi n=1 Tax=Hydrobacter penzbergensis TaxID=1235997 RepID=A0A8X8IC80_9BACT|nr:Capsule assembly protein Wzi [Hydrobacter penzbergensis]